jgi:hypothetical protein
VIDGTCTFEENRRQVCEENIVHQYVCGETHDSKILAREEVFRETNTDAPRRLRR